jgi:hypothetical protein
MASAFGIIGIALGGVALMIILINILKGLIAGFKKALKSLAVIVLAIIIAAIITAIVCNPNSGVIATGMDLIGDLLGEDVGELFAVEELEVTLKYYAAMMVGPFFFTAIFTVIWGILSIVAAIVFKVVPVLNGFIKDRPNPAVHRGGGAGIGLVCGYVVAVVLLMPMVGTFSFMTSMPYDILMEEDADYEQEWHPTREEAGGWQDYDGSYRLNDWYDEEGNRHINSYIDQYGEFHEGIVEPNYDYMSKEDREREKEDFIEQMEEANDTVNIFMNCGCGPLYNAFASAKFEGERVYLKDDVHTLMELISAISNVDTSEDGKLSHAHTDMLRKVTEYVDRSALLRNTVAGIFSTASESWRNGENFMGISKIEGGELMNPVIDELLATLSTTTNETITGDLNAMIGSFEVMIDSGILEDMEYSKMLKELGKEEGVLDQMVVVLHENKRMDKVAVEVGQLSTRALASHLQSGEYGALMSDIASTLNANSGLSAEEKRANVRNDMAAKFAQNGVEIEGKALDDVVDGFITEFDGQSNVTDAQVTEYFASHVIAENADDIEGDFNYGGF